MTPKQLQALQAKWYKKAERSGFVDVESPLKPGSPLKHWSSIKFQAQYTPEAFLEKQRYYELAGQLYHEHKFYSRKHKAVWKAHTEGMAVKEISAKKHVPANTVRFIIEKYAAFIKRT